MVPHRAGRAVEAMLQAVPHRAEQEAILQAVPHRAGRAVAAMLQAVLHRAGASGGGHAAGGAAPSGASGGGHAAGGAASSGGGGHAAGRCCK